MRTSWAIFCRDLRRILRDPVALFVSIGICVVPCLYAWINLLANWDPYENTSDVPVAVVNNDTPQELADMGEVCVGDLMVDALSENDRIGWRFLDEDEAIESVREGSCYAAVVIPEDFTSRLTGILDGQTDKAHLTSYVNEKVNPIAPKVTDAGASTIGTTVDSRFVAKVGEVVAQKLEGVANKLLDESEGVLGDEATALEDVRASLADVSDELGALKTSLDAAHVALEEAVDDLTPLQGLGTRVSGELGDALGLFDKKRADAQGLMADIDAALTKGGVAASALSTQATSDVSAIAGDIALAQAQVNAAIRALEDDLTDDQALTSTITSARDALLDLTTTDDDAEVLRQELQSDLEQELSVMVQIDDDHQAKLDELRGVASRLQSAAERVRDASLSIDDKVQLVSSTLRDANTGSAGAALRQVNTALDTYVHIGGELEASAKAVDPVISQTVSLAQQFADAIAGSDAALDGTRLSMDELAQTVERLGAELSAIRASETWSVLREMLDSNPEGVHDFLAAPVDINEIDLYPVENYASGVAPFFTSLALWVGGIALVAIFKLEVDEEDVGSLRPWQAYFGRWLLFVMLGVVQAVVCCAGDLGIGIQCAHPWAFYLSAIVASFVFVNIIYALSVAFKHLGKALAFTLIILQVPGSAGTYPIEMMPPFFQAIGPWLPFTYSNNALREAVAGFYGANLARDLAMLLAFVIPAILLGMSARAHLVNINALFDRRLRETDHLLVSEPIAIEGNHYRLASVVKALHMPQEYHEEFDARAASFEAAYPTLVRRGLALLLALPLGLFALMLGTDAKLPAASAFAASVIVLYSFLIVVEYLHDRVRNKRALTELSASELEGVLRDTLREETLPLTRIDALLERRAQAAHAAEQPTTKLRRTPDEDDAPEPDIRLDATKGGDE